MSVPGSVIPDDEELLDEELEQSEETGQERQPNETQAEWEARFRGLQGGYQQAVERAARAEQMLFAQQAQNFANSLQDLPAEEAQVAWNNWVQGQQLSRAQQQMASQMTQADQALKMVAVVTLSQKYGVPKEDLMSFNDPDSMEAAAKLAAKGRRSGSKAARKTEKKDDFGSGGSNMTTKPKEKATSIREARQNFREAARKKFAQ